MLMHFMAGILGSAPAPIQLSGSLDATGTSGTVTSETVTVTVPAGNSGVMTFGDYQDAGTVTSTQYSRNGGAFTSIPDGGDTVAFSDGDSIAVRTNSVGVGEGRTFTITDEHGRLVQQASHIYG